MLTVDEAFLKALHCGERPDMALEPPRHWGDEKFATFFTKLKAQTTHEAPVPGT